MPTAIVDPTPAWLKAENASVTDTALTKAMRMIGHLIGADNPTAQVFNLMMTEMPGGEATGGLAKAVQGLKERVIKAYHGSPHDFEQFSLSKIGTGEGAQAYGHGLYFAENPAVAEDYRSTLSNSQPSTRILANGTPLIDHFGRNNLIASDVGAALERSGMDLSKAIQNADSDFIKYRLKSLEGKQLSQVAPGKTYEVAIHADPEDFLDWDKPLSQQSEKVKNWLKQTDKTSFGKNSPGWRGAPEGLWEKAMHQHTGEELYGELRMAAEPTYRDATSWEASKVAASEPLKQAGIPGIKYLDQGSRAAGEGSRNYVVFDDRLIDILKKYGLLLPAAGAASQMGPEQP